MSEAGLGFGTKPAYIIWFFFMVLCLQFYFNARTLYWTRGAVTS